MSEEAPWADVPESLEAALGFIPKMVLFFAVSKQNPQPIKLRAAQLFDDFIVPKDLAPAARAAGLAHLYQRLGADGQTALEWFLRSRGLKQQALATFVSLARAAAAAGDSR